MIDQKATVVSSPKDIENLVLLIQSSYRATECLTKFDKNKLGGILIFPMVFEQSFENTVHAWVAQSSIELGTILEAGTYQVNISVKTYTSHVAGSFLYNVSKDSLNLERSRNAEYVDLEDYDADLHHQMPRNQTIRAVSFAELAEEVAFLEKKAKEAKEKLHLLFKPLFVKESSKISSRISFEDAMGICHLALESVLNRYTRKPRPKSSFKYSLASEVRRTLNRSAITQAGETNQIAQLRTILWHNPSVRSEEELRKLVNENNVNDYSIKEAFADRTSISLNAKEGFALLEDGQLSKTLEVNMFHLYDKMRKFAEVVGLNDQDAQVWLYRIGAFDQPHTVQETVQYFDITVSHFKTIEYRLMVPFASSKRTVASVKTRTAFKKAIKIYIHDDSIVLSRSWMAQIAEKLDDDDRTTSASPSRKGGVERAQVEPVFHDQASTNSNLDTWKAMDNE